MSLLDGLHYRLRRFFCAGRARRETEEELEFHLQTEMLHQEQRTGTPQEIRRAAQSRLGNTLLIREVIGDRSARTWFDACARDLHLAARALARARGFAAGAMGVAAVGIGTVTAVVGVLDTVVFQPLPFANAEELMLIWRQAEGQRNPGWLSVPEYEDLRSLTSSFQEVAAARDVRYILGGGGEPQEVPAVAFSSGLLRLLGVSPSLGRAPTDVEDAGAGARVALLSDGLWRARFAARADIVGTKVLLDEEPYEIIGVLPPGFRLEPPSSVFPSEADVWVPLASTIGEAHREGRDIRFLHVVARLRRGVTPSSAGNELNQLARRWAAEHPDTYGESRTGLRVVGYREHVIAPVRPALMALSVTAVILFLGICANLAGLMVSRWQARAQDISTRIAIGGSRLRVTAQLAWEAWLLAAGGAAGAIIMCTAALSALRHSAPQGMPRAGEIAIGPRILAIAAAAALFAAITLGVLPAWRATGVSASDAARASNRTTSSRDRRALRERLVVLQLAVALALLASTGLLLQTLVNLQRAPLGFDPVGVTTARVSLTSGRFGEPADRVRFVEEWVREINHRGDGVAAGAVGQLPLSGAQLGSSFALDRSRPEAPAVSADLRGVVPGYFESMRIPLVAGRYIADGDRRDGLPVAVVDEAFVSRYLQEGPAVGKQIMWTRNGQWLEIVGVVASVRHDTPLQAGAPTVYRPYAQYPASATLYISLRGMDEAAAFDLLRTTLASRAPELALSDMAPMRARVRAALAQSRFNALLMLLFAAAALLVVATGVFAVLSLDVTERTREIGIRAALGARSSHLAAVVAKRLAYTLGAAIALGIATAVVLGRYMRTMLYEVPAVDVSVLAYATGLLAVLTSVSAAVPALRAVRIDPKSALNC